MIIDLIFGANIRNIFHISLNLLFNNQDIGIYCCLFACYVDVYFFTLYTQTYIYSYLMHHHYRFLSLFCDIKIPSRGRLNNVVMLHKNPREENFTSSRGKIETKKTHRQEAVCFWFFMRSTFSYFTINLRVALKLSL